MMTQHETCTEVTFQKCDLFLVVKSGVGNLFEENYTVVNAGNCSPIKKTPQKAHRLKGTPGGGGSAVCVCVCLWRGGTSGVLVRQTGNDFWCPGRVRNSQRGSTNDAQPNLGCFSLPD